MHRDESRVQRRGRCARERGRSRLAGCPHTAAFDPAMSACEFCSGHRREQSHWRAMVLHAIYVWGPNEQKPLAL